MSSNLIGVANTLVENAPANLSDANGVYSFHLEQQRNSFAAVAQWASNLSIIYMEAHHEIAPNILELLSLCKNVTSVNMDIPAKHINTILARFPKRLNVTLHLSSQECMNLILEQLAHHFIKDYLLLRLKWEENPRDCIAPLKCWGLLQPVRKIICFSANYDEQFVLHPLCVRWLTLALAFRRNRARLLPELTQYIAEEYGQI